MSAPASAPLVPPHRHPLQPGLLALHGNRSELLAQAVFAWLERHPLDPLESEIVLVQSNGVAEWFKMALAEHGGVAAAAQVELPSRFLWRTYRQILGAAAVPPRSPVDKGSLLWRLMRDLPEWAGQPGWEPLASYLQGGRPERLWQLACRLADLYDQYQVYRPDWLGDWAEGQDRMASPGRPPLPLPGDAAWQACLWRAILATVPEAERAAIRPHVHRNALARLQAGEAPASALPRRVVLFGMSQVPQAVLDMLAAMARHSQVLMAVPNPCRFHWADAVDGRELLAAARRRQPLRGGVDLAALPLASLHAHAHPLLASWGRQGRDFVRQLDAFDDAQAERPEALPRVDLFDDSAPADAPLLAQVQNRIRDLVPLAEHPPTALADGDRSVVFHSAHSALREVEVLHDQLLELLAQAPAGARLAPRDIVVMVPDVARFAPAIRAVFGQVPRSDARFIPWGIADLSARDSHPLMGALDWLLRLPQQRCTLSELQGLLEVPAIAARLRLPPGGGAQLAHWMAEAGIRWGLDAEQRAVLGLAACGEQNSAAFGLDRMLLGYAAGDAHFGGIEGWDEIGGLDAELAGVLAALLERLRAWATQAAAPAPPLAWGARFRALLADLALPQDEADRQTLQALDAALAEWLAACDDAGFEERLPLDIARAAWQQALDAPRLGQRFRAGGVTFCTLLPLRAIPFEVVCLLGMNDGDYPRRTPRSDFDLMGLPGTARPGDRSRQSDDRQLMLEALLSARRVLYVSWAGRSTRDNSEQPPSVLVSQLRDYLAAGWGEVAVTARTTEHPLQPFSRRYFEGDARLFTHAREWRAAHAPAPPAGEGAASQVEVRSAPKSAAQAPLSLARLARFIRHPARSFLRERLGVVFEPPAEAVSDDESFAVAGLDGYQLAQELLEALDAEGAAQAPMGHDSPRAPLAAALQGLRRAGRLPMAGLGERAAQTLLDELLPMAQAWRAQCALWSAHSPRLAVHLSAQATTELIANNAYGISARGHFYHKYSAPCAEARPPADATALDDWLEPLCNDGGGRIAVLQRTASRVLARAGSTHTPPRIRPAKLVACWLQALAAAVSGAPLHGVLVARDALVTWEPMAPETAREPLAAVLALWQASRVASAPLPLPLATALAHAEGGAPQAIYEGAGGDAGAPGEATEPEWERFYPDFDALTADGRFAQFAAALHTPLAQWVANALTVTPLPAPARVAQPADEGAA